MPEYTCDCCEDTEFHEEWNLEEKGFHCECGGHLYLSREDHFQENPDFNNKCDPCLNKGTKTCRLCKHQPEYVKYINLWR